MFWLLVACELWRLRVRVFVRRASFRAAREVRVGLLLGCVRENVLLVLLRGEATRVVAAKGGERKRERKK